MPRKKRREPAQVQPPREPPNGGKPLLHTRWLNEETGEPVIIVREELRRLEPDSTTQVPVVLFDNGQRISIWKLGTEFKQLPAVQG